MAEWHELSAREQTHANAFVSLIDSLSAKERAIFDSIKHDYEKTKNWLHNHPMLASGATLAGLTGAYIARRYNIGPQLPPPPRRY